MRRLLLSTAALLGLSACPPKPITEVVLRGRIHDGPESIDGVAGGTIEVRTVDGAIFSSATADAAGDFSIEAPPAQPVFLVTNGADHVATSFTVNVGSLDVDVPDNAVWARRASVLAEVQADFTGCGTADSATSTVEGLVRLYLGDVAEDDQLPVVSTARILGDDGSGVLRTACYLDADGDSDPTASETGETGRYGLFGLDPGPAVLTVEYDAEGTAISTELLLYVPEGGTVPLYPTLVPIL